jgi:hypothetical protein
VAPILCSIVPQLLDTQMFQVINSVLLVELYMMEKLHIWFRCLMRLALQTPHVATLEADALDGQNVRHLERHGTEDNATEDNATNHLTQDNR